MKRWIHAATNFNVRGQYLLALMDSIGLDYQSGYEITVQTYLGAITYRIKRKSGDRYFLDLWIDPNYFNDIVSKLKDKISELGLSGTVYIKSTFMGEKFTYIQVKDIPAVNEM